MLFCKMETNLILDATMKTSKLTVKGHTHLFTHALMVCEVSVLLMKEVLLGDFYRFIKFLRKTLKV